MFHCFRHSTVGTLLKVRDVTFFDDGRSIVDCIGFRRFITSNTEKKDGYNVATLSFIVDEKVTEETAVNELLQLIDTVCAYELAFNELFLILTYMIYVCMNLFSM